MIKYDLFREVKSEPKPQEGASIPLFERLIDEDPTQDEETPIKRFYNKEELMESIEQELVRILGTRGSLKKEDFTALENDVLNCGFPPFFGLSDFSHYDGTNQSDYPHISRLCEEAIERFEPRLKNVRVDIQTFDKNEAALVGSIQAFMNVDLYQSEVTFPMVLKVSK